MHPGWQAERSTQPAVHLAPPGRTWRRPAAQSTRPGGRHARQPGASGAAEPASMGRRPGRSPTCGGARAQLPHPACELRQRRRRGGKQLAGLSVVPAHRNVVFLQPFFPLCRLGQALPNAAAEGRIFELRAEGAKRHGRPGRRMECRLQFQRRVPAPPHPALRPARRAHQHAPPRAPAHLHPPAVQRQVDALPCRRAQQRRVLEERGRLEHRDHQILPPG